MQQLAPIYGSECDGELARFRDYHVSGQTASNTVIWGKSSLSDLQLEEMPPGHWGKEVYRNVQMVGVEVGSV